MGDDPYDKLGKLVKPGERARTLSAPTHRAAAVGRPGGRLLYEAFGVKDHAVRLDVRCAGKSPMAHCIAYEGLLQIVYNRRTYGELFLTAGGLTIAVRGKRLRPVVEALKLHACEFVQQYDVEEFAEPADPEAPLIETIGIESTSSTPSRPPEGP